jgi:hypothetical protein
LRLWAIVSRGILRLGSVSGNGKEWMDITANIVRKRNEGRGGIRENAS